MAKMTYQQLTQAIEMTMSRLDAMDTFLTGVVAILGREEVLQAARDYVEEERARTAETLRVQVASGVAEGWLKPIPVSGLKSLVVGEERTGTADAPPVRMQVIPVSLAPKDRGHYIGRTVDEEFAVSGPTGLTVRTKVTEIYEIDEARRRQVIEEHQAKVAAEAKMEEPLAAEAKAAEEALAAETRPTAPPAVEAKPACTPADPCFEDDCPSCQGGPNGSTTPGGADLV